MADVSSKIDHYCALMYPSIPQSNIPIIKNSRTSHGKVATIVVACVS